MTVPIGDELLIKGPLLDRSWGVLALLHLALIEEDDEAVGPLYGLLRSHAGPAWDALHKRHPDGWAPIHALAPLVGLVVRRSAAPAGAGWATRRAELARWALGEQEGRAAALRGDLHTRGAWRLPCGHTLYELSAPGVCDGCTWEAKRRAGLA